MVYIVYGLNHKTAPLTIREKFAAASNGHDILLSELLDAGVAREAVILSTCNRTEMYCYTPDPKRLMDWFAHKHDVSPSVLATHCYLHREQEAIQHTLRVATGLDSMMLGEPQIFGQMKEAFQNASALGAIKKDLRPLFEYVFSKVFQ